MKAGMITVMLLCFVGSSLAQSATNYGKGESWLCRPGRHDACEVDLTSSL